MCAPNTKIDDVLKGLFPIPLYIKSGGFQRRDLFFSRKRYISKNTSKLHNKRHGVFEIQDDIVTCEKRFCPCSKLVIL